jgi:hypothetical protein
MSAAQKALDAAAVERSIDPVGPTWSVNPEPEAVESPALALQAAIVAAYGAAAVEATPEPEVRKWPGWARVAFLLVAAAGSWCAVIGLVALTLAH